MQAEQGSNATLISYLLCVFQASYGTSLSPSFLLYKIEMAVPPFPELLWRPENASLGHWIDP